MLTFWARLKGLRTHIVNALFALPAIGVSAWQVLADPSVQGALAPAIPAKWASLYALGWALANVIMRQVTDGPSRLKFRNPNQ